MHNNLKEHVDYLSNHITPNISKLFVGSINPELYNILSVCYDKSTSDDDKLAARKKIIENENHTSEIKNMYESCLPRRNSEAFVETLDKLFERTGELPIARLGFDCMVWEFQTIFLEKFGLTPDIKTFYLHNIAEYIDDKDSGFSDEGDNPKIKLIPWVGSKKGSDQVFLRFYLSHYYRNETPPKSPDITTEQLDLDIEIFRSRIDQIGPRSVTYKTILSDTNLGFEEVD